VILEYHTSARYAWLQEQSSTAESKTDLTSLPKILLWLHNLVFWFFLIPFFTPLSYSTGFTIYSIILLIRFIANSNINLRDFSPSQYYAYPFRIP
jgi:hypothetical protein